MSWLKTKLFLACASIAFLHGSCATLLSGTTQVVKFDTIPPGATVVAAGTGQRTTTPGSLTLERRWKGTQVLINLDGYEGAGKDYPYNVATKFEPLTLLNIVFIMFCPVGFLVDAATGAMWKYEDNQILPLNKK